MKNIVKMTTVALFLAGSMSLVSSAAGARDHNRSAETHGSADSNHSEGRDSSHSNSADHANQSHDASGSRSHKNTICPLPTVTSFDCVAAGAGETEGTELGETSEATGTDTSTDGTSVDGTSVDGTLTSGN